MKSKFPKYLYLLAFLSIIYLVIMGCVFLFTFSDEPIPITGLSYKIHFLLLGLIFPFLASLLAVWIFPRLLAPLFIFFKNRAYRGYQNGVISGFSPRNLTFKKFIKRAIFCTLLTFGLVSTINSAIDISYLFVRAEDVEIFTEIGIPLQYTTTVFGSLLAFGVPLAIGISSIGWALEDSGIIHYYLPKAESDQYYEIEPVHFKYDDMIEGFAGITALFYFIGLLWFYITQHPEESLAIFWIALNGIVTIFFMTIPYMFYTRISRKFLTKKLPEVKKLNQSDILLK
jgi:hypothetical protein